MYKIATLDNGLRIASEEMRHMESVAIGVWIRAGGRYEAAGNSGISHLLEHLLFKGTETRDMKAIKEAVEGKGGSFNGFTSEEHTCYLIKILAKDAELAVDILSDMVLRPKIAPEEVEKEKSVIIEEINMYKDMPAHYVHELLAELMWPAQPIGMPLAGSVESVRAITRDAVVAYKDAYYNPKNMFVIGAGRIAESDLAEKAKRYLAAVPARASSKYEKARAEQREARCNIYKKDTEQTHVALGFHAIDRFHPDRHVMSIANIILGANMSSRLFHIVRDEMALCYEISSSVRRYEDCGAFVVSAGVEEKKLAKALETVLGELKRVTVENVSEEELRRAKEYYRGQLLFALEDTMSHMLWLGEKIVSGEKDFSVKSILERVEAVTPGDIARVTKGIFRNDNLNLSVIGPVKDEKKIKDMLRF